MAGMKANRTERQRLFTLFVFARPSVAVKSRIFFPNLCALQIGSSQGAGA